jgi:hypothetical protein
VVPLNTAVFASLYNTLVSPLMATLTAMLGAICTTMQPIALGMVLLWLGFVAFDISNGTKTVQQALRDFFIAGMVIGALQTAHNMFLISSFRRSQIPLVRRLVGRDRRLLGSTRFSMTPSSSLTKRITHFRAYP